MKSIFRTPWGLADACVLIAFVSLLVVQSENFARDPGVGWHLKTGELILSSWAIPRIDPFLALPAPELGQQAITTRTWVSDQWLSDVLLSLLYKAGSWTLLFAVGCLIFCLTFFGILYKGLISIGKTHLATAIACVVAFKLAQVHFILRPVLFAFPLFAFVFVRALRIRKQIWSAENFSLARQALCLMPVFCLWANMHPSFILGLALLALLALGFALDAWIFELDKRANLDAAIKSLVLMLLCFFATLVNPYFFELHRSIFALGHSDYFMNLNEEWHSPNFKEYSGFLFELVLLFVLGVALTIKNTERKFYFFEILSFLFFTHLSMQFIRILPFFGIAGALGIAHCLESLKNFPQLNNLFALRLIAPAFSNLEHREKRSWRGQALLFTLSAILLGVSLLQPQKLHSLVGELSPSHKVFPYAALQYLREHSEPSNHLIVAASPDWGGFITWQGFPQIRAVIDDRNTLIGENFYREFLAKLKPGAGWSAYLKQLNASHLLLRSESNLAASIIESGKLAVLYQDEVAILFKYE